MWRLVPVSAAGSGFRKRVFTNSNRLTRLPLGYEKPTQTFQVSWLVMPYVCSQNSYQPFCGMLRGLLLSVRLLKMYIFRVLFRYGVLLCLNCPQG